MVHFGNMKHPPVIGLLIWIICVGHNLVFLNVLYDRGSVDRLFLHSDAWDQLGSAYVATLMEGNF